MSPKRLVLTFLAFACAWGGREFPQQPGEEVKQNELLLKLSPGATVQDLAALLPSGIRVERLRPGGPHLLLRLLPGMAVQQLSARLAADSHVAYVEPNRIRQAVASTPNDPSFSLEWGLNTIGAVAAWGYLPGRYATPGNPLPGRAIVAVIDTGTDCTHPDFKNSGGGSTDAAQGGQLSFATSAALVPTTVASPACAWQDDYGHGTHVAGTLAAATSNGTGVAGVAYPVAIATYKALDSSGSGTDSDIATAMMSAADAGAQVISMSLGEAGYSQTLQDAANYAWERNVVIVAAAGNSNSNQLFFPAGASHVIAVAATDGSNQKASFSNYGNSVAIAAPGVSVYSTLPTYPNAVGTMNYGYLSGTSMATPHVSGVAGLLAMGFPGVSSTAIAERLQQSASSSKTGGGWDEYLGYGILNEASAVMGTLRTASVGGIVGQVVDSSNLPVGGAAVFTDGAYVTTASDGLFRLANVTTGKHQVTVSATGYATAVVTATAPPGADITLRIQLGEAAGVVTGAVTDGSSTIRGAAVEALSGGLVQAATISDLDGTFTLPVAPGTYDIRTSAIAFAPQTIAATTVTANGSATVNFALARLGVVAGTVVDPNNAPIANAQVVISAASYSSGAVTDSTGHFTTLGAPAGVYSVTASATGFGASTVPGVSVTANTAATVNFTLGIAVSGLTLKAAAVAGGVKLDNNIVTVGAAAPSDGFVVNVASSDPAAAVPATVTVPAGATSVAFSITTANVSTAATAIISVSGGGATKTATLTINPVTLSSVVLSPASLAGGSSSTANTVTLTGPAPSTGAAVTLSSSDPSAVAPASITVPAGATSAKFTINTANVATATSATIMATYGASKTAVLKVNPIAVSALSVYPAAIAGGLSSSSNSVTLSGPAPSAGAVVTLSSSDPSTTVPASVTVPGGATSVKFTYATTNVAAATVVTISAAYGGITKSAVLTVNPIMLSALSVYPGSMTGGATSTLNKATLNGPAPSTGAVVMLTSSDPSASVPASVMVPAGATSATFSVSTTAVTTATSVIISAAYGGATKTATLTVNPAALSSVALSPTSLIGGATSTANSIVLTGIAPASGAVIELSSSDVSTTAPASVTVPAGATSVKFNIATSAVATARSVTISAAYNGVTKTAILTVNPIALSSIALSPSSIAGGTTSTTNTLYLNAPAPSTGAAVALVSSDPTATVSASVTVPAGATFVRFTVTTAVVTSSTAVTIMASYGGVTKSAVLTVNPASLSSLVLWPSSVTGGTSSSSNTVSLTGPASGSGGVVTLGSSDPSVSVPANVVVPSGANSAKFTYTTTPVSSTTSVTISATYAGVTKTAVLTVKPPAASAVSLSPTSLKGGTSSTANTVYLTGAAPASGATVTLASSDPAATVPASITVPPGATSATFTIGTTSVAATTTSSISATAGGVTKSATLTINP